MTRGTSKALSLYVLTVLMPVVAAVTLTSMRWSDASDAIAFAHHRRGVQAATEVLVQEMGAAQRDLAARAPVVDLERPLPTAIRAAEAGDTISGLASSEESLELSVVFVDSAGALHMIREPFRPRVLNVLPSVMDLSISLYLRGRRAVSVEPPFGPAELDAPTLAELSRNEDGVEIRVQEGHGALRALGPVTGQPPGVVVLAGDLLPHGQPLSLVSVLAVLSIVLLLSLSANWTVGKDRGEADSPSIAQSGLVTFIPVLAGIVALGALDRSYRQLVTDSAREEMLRFVGFVNEMGLGGGPVDVRIVTGFETAFLGVDGSIETSLEEGELVRSLRRVQRPPPNFTSAGVLERESGAPVLYVAGRVPTGGVLVLLGLEVAETASALRFMMILAAMAMAVPALGYLFFVQHASVRA
jgi:hypothetical protein